MSKKLLLIVLIPAALLLSGYLYLRFSLQAAVRKEEKQSGVAVAKTDSLGGKKVSVLDLRPLFIQRLQQVVKRSSNGLYNLSVTDLKVDVLNSSLVLRGATLRPDKSAEEKLAKEGRLPNNVLSVSLGDVVIEGINLDDAVTSKTMDYTLVKLVKPELVVHRKKAAQKAGDRDEDFAHRFLQEMEKLSAKKIVVEDGRLTVYDDAKGGKPLVLHRFSAVLNNLLVDSASRNDKDRFLFARDATVSFRDFSKPTPDGLYNLKIGAVTVKAPQQEVRLTNLSFASPLSRAEFVKRQKLSKELFNLSLPSLVLSKVDWWSLLNEEEVLAGEANAKGGKLSVYLDRSLPPRNKMGNFPNQLLLKLPLKIRVPKLLFSGLDVAYSEYNPLSQQTGTIYIDNVRLLITNLSNLPSNNPPPVMAGGSGLFMHRVPLKATFRFDRKDDRSGKFAAQIQVNGFDGALLNSFAGPMGLMRMDKGVLQGAEASIAGNENSASGDVLVLYNDLKLSLLEKDKGKETLDKKDVTSLLANLLLLKNDNPKKGGEPRREQATFTRQPEGGFLMLVWKTMLVGVLKTIGAPTKLAYKSPAATTKKK